MSSIESVKIVQLFICLHTRSHAASRICLLRGPFTGFLFNDGLLRVAAIEESGGYHPAAEWNTMCAPSGRTFLPAPWFPQVIHAVLIPTVMALSWGSAAPPGPPRFSLWPRWQRCPSAACQPRRARGGWWESRRGQEDEAGAGANAWWNWFLKGLFIQQILSDESWIFFIQYCLYILNPIFNRC